tara:strand:- start:208 stop:417 length:210 start_codon:yes stop_codon:yes gene_type:complete
MDKFELFACEQWLSEFPHDWEFDAVCDAVRNEHDDVLVWEVAERSGRDIVELITSTASAARGAFGNQGD